MIVRIVRMTFEEAKLPDFQAIFDASKARIRQFSGCLHLELHHDAHDPRVRYTYSHWQDQAALDAYRHSDLFASVWPQTKALFAAKPQAFSLLHQETIPSSAPEGSTDSIEAKP